MTFLGMFVVVFGVANLAITRWIMRWRQAGRTLPRFLRTWETYARMPKLAIVLACCQIVVGAVIIFASLV
jgi:hypothetical protein